MSAKVHLLGSPDVRGQGGTMHMASIHHAEVRDYDFADRALALRQRAGLTQRELAAHLGVSYKAIGTWEGGLCYPGAERLKQLIALYLARGVLAVGREEEEATALWESVRATARRRTVPFDPSWFAALRHAGGTGAGATPPALAVVPLVPAPADDGPVAVAVLPAARYDWGEAPAVPAIQGRAPELAALECWVQQERCRLILLLGEGGIGKTTLAAKLAHDLAPAFPAVYWRSLRAAPPAEDWLAGAIAAVSTAQAVLPHGLEARLGLLLELLRERRALLVLDNLETVLEPGVSAVRYRTGHEGYGEVLRQLGTSAHQGCLLATSREQPLREDRPAVRVLRLHGLGVDEVRALLGHRELAGDAATWEALVACYGGNPLALQAVGETASAVFGGDLAAFLAQDVAVFGEIRQLLAEQVARLSGTEHAVLACLAAERTPVGCAEVVSHLRPAVGRAAVVEALEALARRSLLEHRDGGTFTLPLVVRQYATTPLSERAGVASRGDLADGVVRGRCAAQPGARGRATARWGTAWPGANAAGPRAGQPGHSPAAVQRPMSFQAPRRVGRESRRTVAS